MKKIIIISFILLIFLSFQGTGQLYPYASHDYEKYTGTWERDSIISRDGSSYWKVAQTFTVGNVGINENFYLTEAKIYLGYGSGSPSTMNCDITIASADKPTSTVLGTAYTELEFSIDKEYRFFFSNTTPVLLRSSTQYAFVVWINSDSYTAWSYIDCNPATYTGGKFSHSDNNGPWTHSLYGYPSGGDWNIWTINGTTNLQYKPLPAYGTTQRPIQVSINVTDSWGDTFDINIHGNYLNNISLYDQINGTFSANTVSLPYNTDVWWYVDIFDHHRSEWGNKSYYFHTPPFINYPPNEPTNATPISDYEDVYDIYLNCTVSDPNEGVMNVSFYWGNDTFIGIDNNVMSLSSIYLPDYIEPDWLAHDTMYYWYVNISDGGLYNVGPTWNFKTCKAWDLNVDRVINYLDISSLVSHYRETVTPGAEPWDIIEDGVDNYLDISSLVSHYRESY
jgi:hypothetical protein